MLKILIIPSWYPNQINPLEGIFIQEQVELLKTHYDLAVIAINIFNFKTIYQQKNKLLDILSLTINKTYTSYFLSQKILLIPVYRFFRLTYFLYFKILEKQFETLLKEWGKPDLIHAHVILPAGWGAVKLGKKYNIPVILTEHSGPFSMHLTTNYQRSLVEFTLSQVDKLLAVSPSLANQIRQHTNYSSEIESIGNLIKTNFFLPTSTIKKHKEIIFLSICFLNKGKGINYLLKAIHYLLPQYSKQFTVLIGGDGSEKVILQKQAESLNIEKNCQFLGNLSRQKVRDYMQQCDVFILPSLGETFGIVLGEAMSCGKPVISTYCGGPEYIVNDDVGILVNPEDEIALAKAMEKFINKELNFDSEIIRSNISSRFGEEAFLNRMMMIYKLILQEK